MCQMKNAARLVSMIVVALSVALMEKSWVSFSFKSISTVDLACTKKPYKKKFNVTPDFKDDALIVRKKA